MKPPPPPGSFDYLLEPLRDQRAPAIPPPPPPEYPGRPPRVHIEIEITERRPPPRSGGFGTLFLLVFWGLLLWALLGCAQARADSHQQQQGMWCTSYRVGFADYTDCTPIPGSASTRTPSTHCRSYRSGFSRQTVCSSS